MPKLWKLLVMKRVIADLQGKKTYIVAAALIAYAIFGVYTGQLSQDQAVQVVLNGLGLSALRAGISKI
jgi:hypothetical protein